MLKKFNTITTGIIIGVLIPVVLYLLFVWPDMKRYSFIGKYYIDMIVKFLPLFLSRCIFPNAILFFLLIWKDQTLIAKGLLISTAVLTAALLFVSFIL